MDIARTEGELMSQRRKMTTDKLYLSFWHIDLGNLPEGNFRHWQVLPNDAKNYIQEAQLAGRLFCVSNDDLLAPFRERERENHQEFCAMLSEQFGVRLSLRDFCTEVRMRAVRSSPSSDCRWLRSRIRIVLW
jgi:hypothetical protein